MEAALRGVLETVSEREARVSEKKSDSAMQSEFERFYVACRFQNPIRSLGHG